MAGYPWLSSFLRRNPDLSIRKSEGLSAARAKGLSRRAVKHFYDLLEKEITTYKLQKSHKISQTATNQVFNSLTAPEM